MLGTRDDDELDVDDEDAAMLGGEDTAEVEIDDDLDLDDEDVDAARVQAVTMKHILV